MKVNTQQMILILLVAISSCATTRQSLNSPKGTLVVLENEDKQCSTKEITNWFFLWGMIPMREQVDFKSLFSESDKTFRITKKYTTEDIWINIPVAFTTPFIRSTTQIDTCPSEVVVVAKEDYNRKEEKVVEPEPAKSQPEIAQKMPLFIEKRKVIFTLQNKQVIACPKVNLVSRQGEYYFEAYSSESNPIPLLIKNSDVKRIEFEESK